MPLDTSRIRERIRALSDDGLRSEYVSACALAHEWDIVSRYTREYCRQEALDRGIILRGQVDREKQLVADLIGDMLL